MKAKAKKCTCCQLHNSTNVGKGSVIPKRKFIEIGGGNEPSRVFRLTVDCFPEDFQCIRDEAEAYGSILKEEKEVIDNG